MQNLPGLGNFRKGVLFSASLTRKSEKQTGFSRIYRQYFRLTFKKDRILRVGGWQRAEALSS